MNVIQRSRSERVAGASIAMLLLGASLVAGVGCSKGESADAAEAAPPAVNVGPENIAVVTTTLLASGPAISGALQPAEEATVRAEVSGAVLETFVDQGSRVSKGTPLARLNDITQRDQVISARSAVTTARSSADLAKRQLERQTTLFQAGAIAERDVEDAKRANDAAQSQLADAQARLTLAEKQLADARLTAPFAGLVSARYVSAGDVVQPGGQLFTIVDPTSMRLEASVPADQLNAVKIGSPVTFTVNAYPGRTFTGKVSRINPTVDVATGQVKIVAAIPNSTNNLVAGLFADGRVSSATHTGMTVPSSAVDVRSVKPWVLRLHDGKAERREVELGLKDEETERVEIVSGVAAGDTLLLGAAQGISPGSVVRVSAPADKAVVEKAPTKD
jgi:membrane fusion protein, multidrug efflux system